MSKNVFCTHAYLERCKYSISYKHLIIPPKTKFGGGILESGCPSVRLSVRADEDTLVGYGEQ